MKETNEELVEWRPVWTGAELEHYSKLRGDIEPQITLLRALRDRLDLTQKEVADLLDTTQSNVSKIEAKADPSLSVIKRLVESRGGKLRLTVDFAEGGSIELAA
jgi:DNA-binding XRE family transcriptional regulator